MPPKKRDTGKRATGVRGPNSALTEFLRNEGITDAFRQQRENMSRRRSSPASPPPPATLDSDIVTVSGDRSEDEGAGDMDDEEKEIRIAAAKKRRATRSRKRKDESDSDDSDDNFVASNDDDDLDENAKKFGDEDTCVECGDTFNLTVYSRYLKPKGGYICELCNTALKLRERAMKRNELNARKKRKQVAQALLDKKTVRLPKLSDVCARVISSNIGQVDAFGDIGHLNMAKISRILSKNRLLNSSTLDLFLKPDLLELQLWDCSNVDSDALNRIASFCPKIQSLTLFMCGQLHNDNLQYFNSNLPDLEDLLLNGPFLISDSMWTDFLTQRTRPLRKFEVRNTHRFSVDALQALLKTCGSHLQLLKLSRLDGLSLPNSFDEIPQFLGHGTMTELEISFPHNPDQISDELMILILEKTGSSLISLNVDGCTCLTDRFVREGVAKFCSKLQHLSMRFLPLVSDEGFAQAFNASKNSGGLISVDLTKCTGLGDKAAYALFAHSGHTLVELSLNSIHNLSKDMLFQAFTKDSHPYKVSTRQKVQEQDEELGTANGSEQTPSSPDDEKDEAAKAAYYEEIRLPLLTSMDLGFVRAVDNEILGLIDKACPRLSVVEVYGDNRCNFGARVKDGLMIIGRQGDEV